MSKEKPRRHERPATQRQAGKPQELGHFPDELHVRAFAERLLQKKPEGSYELVQSERRSSLGSSTTLANLPEVSDDTTLPNVSPPLESGPEASVVNTAGVSKTFRSASSSDEPMSDPGECLSEDSILAFVQGRLGGAELVAAHGHLDLCTDCQRLIAEAAHAISSNSGEGRRSDSGSSNLGVGTMLNERYRIQRFVARGGMGEVYEAYDRVLRERIALKTVTATVSDSPRAVRRLMAEVQLARRVSHPNVCRIYDLGAHTGEGGASLHFLSMEFVAGMSLGEKLERDGPVPVNEAVLIAQQLLSGLHAAHEAGILHRDLKPDNIMLRPSRADAPRVVVMDFGLARAIEVDPARLTTGADQPLIGTLSYMAPEQVEGGKLTAGTDIFAFGIVLFEMLTGCLPFVGSSPAATALKRLKEAPPAPSEYAPSLPRYHDKVVLRCLARDPLERYLSAADVSADLTSQVARPGPLSTAQRNRRWVVAASAGALVAGSAALLGVSSKPAPSAAPSANADLLAAQPDSVPSSLVRPSPAAAHPSVSASPNPSAHWGSSKPASVGSSAAPASASVRAARPLPPPAPSAQQTSSSAESGPPAAARPIPKVPSSQSQQATLLVPSSRDQAEPDRLLVPKVFASDRNTQQQLTPPKADVGAE
jgi:serine/threonine protein kinase